jgi:glycosyltransferase involved in cell wall biosynthesis
MGARAEPTPAGVGYPAQLTSVGRSGSQNEEGSGVAMRVAWFGHAGGRRADGLTAYSDQTVTALAAAGCEIRFFHHDLDGDSTPVADVVALEGVRFKTVTLPAPRTLARIERALADFRPDVVHCSVSVSLLDGAVARVARGLGAATVATCHLPYAPAQSARDRVMRRLYHYHAARFQEYDRCIALSNDQRDLLVRVGVAPERIVVMPNAVDTQRICPGPSALKQALGAELMVSFLGRLDPEKRVEELIHSFLARRWPSDHLLVIAGSGSQDRRLRAIAGPEGAVRFLGMVTRMEDRLELLRATDLFVLPSTAEGLSLALLEAMAAGCAIVATDAGEHGAVLDGDGAGLVIPVYPLEPALGEAMERLRGDPAARRRLGEAARSRAVAHHSLDAYVADLLGLYASAAAGHEVGSALR